MPDLKLPALDPMTVESKGGTNYPAPLAGVVDGRAKRRLTALLGLTNFGVNVTTLKPGAASSHRHWHTAQDEFIYVISGEVTLVTDLGKQVLGPGMCAGFPKNKPDGHHLVNHTATDAMILEVGDRSWPDGAQYPDVDLWAKPVDAENRLEFVHKDGSPY
jgi:uncharacterized cupin superfamily protein